MGDLEGVVQWANFLDPTSSNEIRFWPLFPESLNVTNKLKSWKNSRILSKQYCAIQQQKFVDADKRNVHLRKRYLVKRSRYLTNT